MYSKRELIIMVRREKRCGMQGEDRRRIFFFSFQKNSFALNENVEELKDSFRWNYLLIVSEIVNDNGDSRNISGYRLDRFFFWD